MSCNKRDIQIILHHILAIMLLKEYSKNKYATFLLYSVLESSSCVIMLSKILHMKCIKRFSQIYWIIIRLFWINWFHYYVANCEYNIYFQMIKWLGYMWTLESFKIELLPCNVSYLSSFEMILYSSFYYRYKMLGLATLIIIPISFLHHYKYENSKIKVVDSIMNKLYCLYTTHLFYNKSTYMENLIHVGCMYLIVYKFETKDRSWKNIIWLIPHMMMHIFAGNGIISSLKIDI